MSLLLSALCNPIIRILRGVFYTTTIVGYTFGANVVFWLSGLLYPFAFAKGLVWEMNSHVAYGLWVNMQRVLERDCGVEITFSGDEILQQESAFVISNHVSYTDFYALQALALRRGMLPYCRYFIKKSLIYLLPIIGLSFKLSGMIMVSRNFAKDSKSIKKAYENLEYRDKLWICTFLEGTRVTKEKLEQSRQWAESKGKPVLKNVLYPRPRGFVASLKALRSTQIQHIYDITIAYSQFPSPKSEDKTPIFQRPPTMLEIHTMGKEVGKQFRLHIHTRRFPISSLPLDDDEVIEWTEKLFEEKDEILEVMKTEWIGAEVLGTVRTETVWPPAESLKSR